MPGHRTGQVVACAKCGTETYRKAGEIARSKGRLFCSLACRNAAGPRTDLATRFWSYVNKSGPIIVPELGPCWIWTKSARSSQGHGGVWDGKRWTHAHRVAYTLANGPIPPGMEVCHRCDNPPCCRPDHLFLGSHLENMADMQAKRRKKRISADTEQRAVTLIGEGQTYDQVIASLGIGRTTLKRILQAAR